MMRLKYLIDNRFCLDGVIRYENLYGDMRTLCQKLDIDCKIDTLPRYKSGFRPKEATVEKMYTRASCNAIKYHFAFELEYFNYDSPSLY